MTPSETVDYSLWTDAGVVRGIAVVAVALLVVTILLFRRRRRSGRAAAMICLVLSVGLHTLLLVYVPKWQLFQTGGGREVDPDRSSGVDPVAVAVLESQVFDMASDAEVTSNSPGSESVPGTLLAPLPVNDAWKASQTPAPPSPPSQADSVPADTPDSDLRSASQSPVEPPQPPAAPDEGVSPTSDPMPPRVPATLAAVKQPAQSVADPKAIQTPLPPVPTTSLESELGDWMQETLAELQREASITEDPAATRSSGSESPSVPDPVEAAAETATTATPLVDSYPGVSTTAPAPVVSTRQEATKQIASDDTETFPDSSGGTDPKDDFVARRGAAKRRALQQTGGNAQTEQAVQAALRFLVANQRADGGWDPAATGAGIERSPLGLHRGNAGRRADTAITGLALMSLLGAGNTHQEGDYRESVYKGLAFLIGRQKPDGSLAGAASVYAAHYSHAMATLAMAEAAAMTADASAIESTRRAIGYTASMQHPVTGGWRYTRGDPGDLSQLGWHVMSIDAAVRSEAIDQTDAQRLFRGARRFLDSVRTGNAGGQACYRPGERPTVTMTAEALAARLMMGDRPGEAAIAEAERVILRNLPPRGNTVAVDNYYYWYYATLALHQLQDDAWATWNETLKERLLATQRPDGSWPTTSLWGGYGGTVYTTSMATLCLEAYYRHGLRR